MLVLTVFIVFWILLIISYDYSDEISSSSSSALLTVVVVFVTVAYADLIIVDYTMLLNDVIIEVTPFDVVILVFSITYVTVLTKDVITLLVAIVVSLANEEQEFIISEDSVSVNDDFS